jgi:hypothetical protein
MIAALQHKSCTTMKNIALAARGFALVTSLVLAACGGGGSTPTLSAQPQSARAAPPATCGYWHVWVTVTAVRVLQDNGGVEQWQDIALASPQRIDLLAASSGILQALGAAPLQAGHYTQLRLVLAADGNTVQPSGGVETTLAVPSGSASGVKLVGDITVASGNMADVALSAFDPCASIVVTGNGAYNLKPEAQATMTPVAQAGPEVAGPAGDVLKSPDGSYALADHGNWGTPWTLQRFDASGHPVGSPFSVTTGDDIAGSFAALAGGGYAAVWLNSTTTNGVNQVMTQAWDAAGNALSAPTAVALVHPGGMGPPALPKIAALAGGGYAITWGLPPDGTGIYAQRYTSAGAAAAPAVQATASGRGSLGITALASGGYLVAWGQFAPSGGVQAYSASDVPVGPVQAAGSNGDGAGPPVPVLRGLTGGGAVIAWQAALQHLMMQPVDANGAPLTAPQVVDDLVASPIYSSIAIGALPDGANVIAWTEGGNAYARRYSASGTAAGPQVKINMVTTGVGGPTGIAVLADGSFAIHWSVIGGDGSRQWYVRTFPAGALTA